MSVNKVLNTGELQVLAGGTLYAAEPVGSVKIWMSNTIPNGYLLCNGQAVSKTTYADLYAVIGSTFGETNTTFNVPDLRGEFLRGAGTNSHSGQGSGGSVGQHQDASAVRPTYVTADNNFWIGNGAAQEMVLNADGQIASANPVVKNTYTASGTGMTSAISVRPTNTSVNFIIKATTIALPSDFEDAVDEKIAANIVDSITDGNMKAATSNAVFDALVNCKRIGDVFFSNDFRSSGTAPSFAATASHTITIAGTYFVYVSGNPYAADTDMTATIQYNNVNVGFNSITNSAAANYSIISCVCMVQASVGGVISVGLTGATNAGGYNHYGIFRIA